MTRTHRITHVRTMRQIVGFSQNYKLTKENEVKTKTGHVMVQNNILKGQKQQKN